MVHAARILGEDPRGMIIGKNGAWPRREKTKKIDWNSKLLRWVTLNLELEDCDRLGHHIKAEVRAYDQMWEAAGTSVAARRQRRWQEKYGQNL